MKLAILPFSITVSIFFALMGLVAGIFYALGGFVYDLFTIGLNAGTALAFLSLIGMPVIFGSFGFGFGLLLAILYNCYIFLCKTR